MFLCMICVFWYPGDCNNERFVSSFLFRHKDQKLESRPGRACSSVCAFMLRIAFLSRNSSHVGLGSGDEEGGL
jgi:hypothetical protein